MRKGVQVMIKRLTSFFLVLALSFSLSIPVFATDDNNYYSFPPVGGSEPSVAMDWPVNPSEFDNNDSTTLTNIYKIIQYLFLSPASWQGNSVIGFLQKIFDRIPSNLGTNFALQGGEGTNAILDGIRDWVVQTYNYLGGSNIAGNLGTIQRNTLVTADRLLSLISAFGDGGLASENSLSTLVKFFTADDAGVSLQVPFYTNGSSTPTFKSSFKPTFGFLFTDFLYDSTTFWNGGDYTIFHYIKYSNQFLKLLQETLASEDDRQLADNYKDNRQQAEQDFLSGKSGKTSLGKGDFSNASQVGGALNDTFNMGGAAKVSDFLSGFGSAGSEAQAWFSQTTSNNLNAVEAGDGTQGVSTFADDGESMIDVDPDPYNMGNIFERYDWLEGVNMDD